MLFSIGHDLLLKTESLWSSNIRIQKLKGSKDFIIIKELPKKEWLVKPGDLQFAWAEWKVFLWWPTLDWSYRGLISLFTAFIQ